MKLTIGLIVGFTVLFISAVGLSQFVMSYKFNNGCANHLSRAANASTVEIAKVELDTAIAYLEKHNMTSGNTDIVLNRTSNDIGYFYSNLKAASNELKELPDTTVAKTNALMKLREVIIEHGQHGEYISAPSHISYYPYVGIWYVADWIALILLILSAIGITIFTATI